MRERPLRESGTPYSSVGLIWRDFGRAALPALLQTVAPGRDCAGVIWTDIDAGLITEIDQADNGVAPVGVGHLSSVIEAFNPVWDRSEGQDAAFLEASRLAEGILARASQQAHASARATSLVLEAARTAEPAPQRMSVSSFSTASCMGKGRLRQPEKDAVRRLSG